MAAVCTRCGQADSSLNGANSAVSARDPGPIGLAQGACPECGHAEESAIWHVAADGEAHGPYTRQVLLGFRRAGLVTPDQLVHRAGWDNWRFASAVEELREGSHPVSVAPPAIPSLDSIRGEGPEPAAPAVEPHEQAAVAPVVAPVDHMLARQLFQGEMTMGQDPFAEAVVASVQGTYAGEVSEAPPAAGRLRSANTPSRDLDDLPALDALSNSGRGLGVGSWRTPVPIGTQGKGERSGVMNMASMLAAEKKKRPIQDPTLLSFATVRGSLRTARLAKRWKKLRAQTRAYSLAPGLRAPGMMMGLALAGLFVGAGSIVAWAVARGPAPRAETAHAVAASESANTAQATPARSTGDEAIRVAGAAPPTATAAPVSAEHAAPALSKVEQPKGDESASGDSRPMPRDASAAEDNRSMRRGDSARQARVNRSRAQYLAKHAKSRRSSAGSKAKSASEPFDQVATGSLPPTPSRDQMLVALGKARTLVARCKGSGMATVSINVKGPAGRASKVSVEGIGGNARSCVESAIRKTPFPRFQQENFAVKAPFKLDET